MRIVGGTVRKLVGMVLAMVLLASSTAASGLSEIDDLNELADQVGVKALATESYVPLPDDPFRGVYFVTQQYRDMLGREPDVEGLAYWNGRLEQGLGPAALVASFVDSPEFAQSRLPVARLYLAALGRMPEEDGWSYWSGVRSGGVPLTDLAVSFISTPEGRLRLGVDDPDELIEALYQNVLDRSPDEEGAAYWRSQLAAGVSRAEVVVSFAESEEFRSQVDSIIRASLLYSGLLGREPEVGGLAYWDGELRRGAPFEGVVGGFVDSPEYKNRLSGLWCNIVDEDGVVLFDGPDRNELNRDEWFDDAYRRMQENAQNISNSFDSATFDEVRFGGLDWWPDRQFLLAVHTDAVESSCLTFLGRAPHPEQVTFVRAPYLSSELEAAWVDIRARLENEHPQAWFGKGGLLRLNLTLSGPALPVVDEILTDYGAMIDVLTVGAFSYPMPDPLPEAVCLVDPGAIDDSTLGLEVTVEMDSSIVVAGDTPAGTFTVTNTGTETYTVAWGAEVTGVLGSGSASTSVFRGNSVAPLSIGVIGPGQSTSGSLRIGTEACDPIDGHRLPSGDYPIWGTVSVWDGDESNGSLRVPDHYVRLPADTITLTD